MFNMGDLLGAVMQSVLSGSTANRMRNAMASGERAPEGLLSDLLGGSGPVVVDLATC